MALPTAPQASATAASERVAFTAAPGEGAAGRAAAQPVRPLVLTRALSAAPARDIRSRPGRPVWSASRVTGCEISQTYRCLARSAPGITRISSAFPTPKTVEQHATALP